MRANRHVWYTLALATIVSLVYFGKLWVSPNDYLYTASGDGLQGYYQTVWHAKLDSADWRQNSMNWPYGESLFFTGGQPHISNGIRWLKPWLDLSDEAVGISNMFLLMSGVLASLFLFLLLRALKVREWEAVLFSVGIVMLSQQWERFSGHFALSLLCAVPCFLWLLYRIFNTPKDSPTSSWWWSAGLSMALLFFGLVQFYYFFFAAALTAGFFIAYFIEAKSAHNMRRALQLLIAFALPFLALQALLGWSTDVVDRTSIPWGFLIFRSTSLSYLYPFGMPYEALFGWLKPETGLEWEGLAFIGLAAFLSMLFLVGQYFADRFKGMSKGRPDAGFVALAIAAVLCILASMAFPFNIGFENILYRLGPVQQFRGIGRFAFVAYYPIAILAFAGLYHWSVASMWRRGWMYAMMLLLFVEGHARLTSVAERITVPRGNTFREVAADKPSWMTADYQAIHPLPYVHIGSENIGFSADDAAMRKLYEASLSFQLPTTATVMSRTSLSQSFASCGLAWELMEMPQWVQKNPDKRPLLLLADTAHCTTNDKRLLRFGEFLHSEEGMAWYTLPLSAFEQVLNANAMQADSISNACRFAQNVGLLSEDSVLRLFFPDTLWQMRFQGGWMRMAQWPVHESWQTKTMLCSFWVKDFQRDLIPRSVLEIIQYDIENEVIDYQTEFIGKRVIGLRESNALVEYTIRMKSDAKSISLAIKNPLIHGVDIEISSLLLRPDGANCRILRQGIHSLNNRIYSR